jgi:hypothetical protein
MARRLGSITMVTCATPAYLREFGTPITNGRPNCLPTPTSLRHRQLRQSRRSAGSMR